MSAAWCPVMGARLAPAAWPHARSRWWAAGPGWWATPAASGKSGRSCTLEQIDRNARSIARQLDALPLFRGRQRRPDAQQRRLAPPLRLIEFLRDTGKHFTVSYMLQKESVRSRMEAGISFTEFSYMLIQAYDFWHLYPHRGSASCRWAAATSGGTSPRGSS